MSNVRFLPWVGQAYRVGFAGKRVLVLGESHYCASPQDAVPTITRDVIKGLSDPTLEHEPYMNTYTKFVETMVGRDRLTHREKGDFWESVAFYNFVQSPLPKARLAPSVEEFRSGETAFFEVLEELRPETVVAWGSRLYNNLPKGGMQGDDIKGPDGRWMETWKYFLRDGSPVHVIPIMHPSSSSFSPSYWHEIISTII